ncbi:fibroleukin-like [Saccostrea cucullata]|uniref:fibroleukin-like n=1 Tax=Saccostrea cuccullata TaxID=36930 RepID=UPI002ED5562D
MKLEFNDKKSNNELLGEHSSHSLPESTAMCQAIPVDCRYLQTEVGSISGVYDIYPYRTITMPVTVYCDMKTMGGGWTAIQKRVIGSLSFNRTWTEYKSGFGAPEQDYWIGNDVIHQLTKGKKSSLYISITLQNGTTLYEMYDVIHLLTKGKMSSLYISITLQNGTTLYEMYEQFSISNETGKYQLFLAGPATGTLGDTLIDTGNSRYNLPGSLFSTQDRDNDRYSELCWLLGRGMVVKRVLPGLS